MSDVDLMELVRSKVKELKAYQVESLDEGIKLHANENPYPPSQELLEKIGLKTSIQFNEQGSSGSITLYYSDLDQLDEIMKRLKK